MHKTANTRSASSGAHVNMPRTNGQRTAIPFAKSCWVGLKVMLLFTLLCGIIYPLALTGIGQIFAPRQASGALLYDSAGKVRGSALIGQEFNTAAGDPDPAYFQPRPSSAGAGYDTLASAGSNLGPESPELLSAIAARKQQVAEFNRVDAASVPADALTASGSGLDPHISPAYAKLQLRRVAAARHLRISQLQELVAQHTSGRDLGIFGEPRVNVVTLNFALDQLRQK